MPKKSLTSVTVAEMPRRTEAQLQKRNKQRRSAVGVRKPADTRSLLHELRVHQVELEMQQAELQESRDRMEVLLEKYTDLYDFAPAGYFSLDEQGRILEVNLAGAALLGMERARLANRSLTRFVAPASRAGFSLFLEHIFSGSRKRFCEATLLKADGTALWATFYGTSAGSGRGAPKWGRVAVWDITVRKQAEEALQAAQHELERRVEERTAELQRNCVRLAEEIEERKRAEEEVAKELRFETLLAGISTKFVNLQPGEVDRQILDAQRRIFELLDLDVSGFWQWSADAAGFFRLTHHSRAGENPQPAERMNSQEYLPWFQQQVLAGRTIAIRSMKELPPEAARDRKTFRQFGFKSNLTIPLSVGGEPPIGALGFTTRAERDWPDALIRRLQLVAQIFTNALARRRADQALRESEERFRAVANTAPVLIWMSGPDKLCHFFNKSWLDFTGRPLEAELGNGWVEGVHPEDLPTCLKTYGESFDARRPFTMEYRLRRHDGEYRWVSDAGVPRYDSAQVFLGYIGSCLDISERKEVEQTAREFGGRLIQAQEAERARLARELHDDITQRLARLAIDAGRVESVPDEARRSHTMREIRDGLARLSKDVHSLAYSLHPALLEDLGLTDALKAECEWFSSQESITVGVKLEEIPAEIPKDIGLCLFRVTQEALRNVIRHARATAAEVSLRPLDGGLQLAVTDTGAGFDPGKQRQRPSLGLASMRERVRLLGGELDIESAPGHGTIIVVWVPLGESLKSKV